MTNSLTSCLEHEHVCKVGEVSFARDSIDLDDAPGRDVVEPWISALLQAEHCSLLIGSGFTIGAGSLIGEKAPSMSAGLELDNADLESSIENEAKQAAKEMGRGSPNLEDRLRAAIAAEAGLRIVGDSRNLDVSRSVQVALRALVEEILRFERSFASTSPDRRRETEAILASFLMSFARRTPTRDRLHIFTTNYDRLIEYVCDAWGFRLMDRFVGALSPRFRSSRMDIDLHYNPPGIRGEPRVLGGVIRLSKLHGSIDWMKRDDWIERIPLTFGGDPPPELSEAVLVFPNSHKDIDTAYYPYAELFRDFSSATVRPNSVVITYGYGFGDDHVNRVLIDMLSLPSTHLVIISFDAAQGRIARFARNVGVDSQISVLMGPFYGDLTNLSSNLLPQPSLGEIWARRARILRDSGTAGEDDATRRYDDVS